MKKHFLIALLFNLLLGCTFANPKPIAGNISYFIGDKFAMFYDQSMNKFYAVQYEVKPKMGFAADIAVVEAKKDELIVKELSNGSIHKFTFAASASNEYDVYSVIQFGGTVYNETLLVKANGGKLILNVSLLSSPSNGDDIPEVKCGCKKQGSNTRCEHGGEGSNSCSITDSGGVATANWNHTCSVACDKGYYACCTKDK